MYTGLDLQIDRLVLDVKGADVQKYRVRGIVLHALTTLAHRMETVSPGSRRLSPMNSIEALTVQRINLDLASVSDEQAAGIIADAMFEALVLKVRV